MSNTSYSVSHPCDGKVSYDVDQRPVYEGGPNLSEGLVSYWKLEEDLSADRVDSHGGNNLTATGDIAAVAGKSGSAASFDASKTCIAYTPNRRTSGALRPSHLAAGAPRR